MKVLLYNLGILTREGGAVRGILKSMGAEAVSVSRTQLNEKAGVLAGLVKEQESVQSFEGIGYDKPFMMISGMDDASLDLFLAAMREAGVFVPLKAVLTPYNAGWTLRELMDEISRERAEFER